MRQKLSMLESTLQRVDEHIKSGRYQAALSILSKHMATLAEEERSLAHAYRAKVYLLINEGASNIKAINDLMMCNQLEPAEDRAEHNYTSRIEAIFSFAFKRLGKSGVLAAINAIPDKNRVVNALQQSLLKRSYFGVEFWKPRGLLACSLERGSLLQISEELKKVHKISAKQWRRQGDQHLAAKQPGLALQAYTFSLHQAERNREEVAKAHFGVGNAFFALGWRRDANKEYKEAIKYDPSAFSPYMQRVFLLASSHDLNNLCKAIQLIAEIEAKQNSGSLLLGSLEKKKLSSCIKYMFDTHGKKKIFEAIKLCKQSISLPLLQDVIQDNQHFFGRFFWENRIPFTSCSLEKGTLKEINVYVQEKMSDMPRIPLLI